MLDSAIALNRFGLGARPDDRLPGDPKSWLIDQLKSFQPRPQALAGVPSRSAVIADLTNYGAKAGMDARARKMMREASMATGQPQPNLPPDPMQAQLRKVVLGDYLTMNAARLDSALTSTSPFADRLVYFWSNHFAVSIDKLPIIPIAGLLEFEAIRPHLFGRFSDMLIAAEQHPAMLVFLDQAQSIGPNSQYAQLTEMRKGKQRGLNENLAREAMELHTLGVRTGYTQADVTEFARALTGWTVRGIGNGPGARFIGDGPAGEFRFAEAMHEPGTRSIMGKSYPQQGEAQARAILLDLAANPATARHIATKLARHFAGDDPPQPMVDRLANAYMANNGDLSAVYRALIASPEAWKPQPLKFKTPWEWTVSALRAVGKSDLDPTIADATLKQLGQPTWKPGSPAGWDDVAASWAAPEALMLRVEVAQRIANRAGSSIDARALAEKVLPGSLTQATRTAIARADTPQDGLALLLVSPEFVRR